MKNPDLSVIVLSYNTQSLLQQCLESVFREGGEIEVIVVDNASTDDSPQMVRKEFPEAILICNEKNLGFAAGNNVGITKAKGKYLLFLNSDTKVLPGAFKKTVEFMGKNPKIGAFSPKVLLASGGIDPDCHRGFPTPWASITYFLGLETLFHKSKIFGQYHKFYLGLDKDHEIDAGVGAYMVVRREVIAKVGVWDENYFFYGEDLDFFYRIKQAGFKVMYLAEPLVVHYKGASSGLRRESKDFAKNSKENRLRVARASVKAMEIFYQKFYKNTYPSWLTSLVLLGIKTKGFFRILKHQLT